MVTTAAVNGSEAMEYAVATSSFTGTTMPLPVNGGVTRGAFETILKLPYRLNADCGVKVIETEQDALGAMAPEQLFVCEKSPLGTIENTFRVALPEFVIVMACGALLVATP